MKYGIYEIRNLLTGQVYIGKSRNIENRFVRHKCLLKHGKHFNKHLQRSYNKYGSEAFGFTIIQECPECDLAKNEQFHVDNAIGRSYNQIQDVITTSGETNPFFGRRHTEQTKKLLSELRKNKYCGANNPNYGNRLSLDKRIEMTMRNSSTKLSVEAVLKIKNILIENELDHQQIANLFSVSRSVITRISNGTRWANITGGPVYQVIPGQLSSTHKKRIGLGRKGKRHSEEAKQKIRLARLGKKKE